MTPGVHDLVLYRGDTYAWRFLLWQDPMKLSPVDLTDATAASELRDRSAGKSIMSMQCTITLPNIIDVYLAADLWPYPPVAITAWDLEVTFADGWVQTVLAGKAKVTLDITHSSAALV